MANERILVVDDEANIRDLAQLYLEKGGFRVQTAVDGEQALAQVRSDPPDLLVLDLMLPKIDGLELCRRIRADSNLPILMLTARDDDIDIVVGLEMGADDYLTKPFNPRELVARVRAILRRTNIVPTTTGVRRLADLTIDPAAREARLGDQRLELRTKEFDLLLALVDHANIVLTREQLLDLVWGYEFYGHTRTVDVHIAHLRDRLSGSQLKIETVWGMGYKLIALDTPPHPAP